MGSIVEEWGAGGNGELDNAATQTLGKKIAQYALENGIERPQGYDVSFHYNSDVEQHHFGRSHPMKPWRLQLTKQLILSYGLHYSMDLYDSQPSTKDELVQFHKSDYIDFLSQVNHETPIVVDPISNRHQYGFGDDCPIFDGMFDYCCLYTGANHVCRTKPHFGSISHRH